MNPQKKRDLDRRMLVAPSMLNLLRRANGLDLLDLNESVLEVSEALSFRDPAPLYSTFVGLDLHQGKFVRKFLVLEDVYYPQPGWSGHDRWRYDNELSCADDIRCLFPANCVCFEALPTGADGRLLPR